MSSSKFALPTPPKRLPEDDEGRQRRVAEVTRVVKEFWGAVVEQLGADEAKRIWNQLTQAPITTRERKSGRPIKKAISPHDALLLLAYDRLKSDPSPEKLARYLSESFYEALGPNKVGFTTPGSIERRLRRLLANRVAGKLERVDVPGRAVPDYLVKGDGGQK